MMPPPSAAPPAAVNFHSLANSSTVPLLEIAAATASRMSDHRQVIASRDSARVKAHEAGRALIG